MATSITASVAAASEVVEASALVCNFITVNGIASGFVSLKGSGARRGVLRGRAAGYCHW